MEAITIGQIYGVLVYLVGLCGVVFTVYKTVKNGLNKGFQPIYDKIDKVDMNATKNFLVARISEIKDGAQIDDITKERFIEQYDHYIKPKSEGGLGGNSYIKLEVEKLKSEGKL